MSLPRPRIASVPLSVVTAAYLLFLTNFTFWRKGVFLFAGHEAQLVGLAVALFLLFVAGLVTVSVKYLTKPLFMFLLLVSGAASYFTDTFGTIVDRDMIENMVDTTPSEAAHFVTSGYVLHLFLFGILPALLVAWVRIEHRSFGQKFWRNCAVIFPCLIGAAVIVGANFAIFSSTFREHGDYMGVLNPASPIVGAVKYAKRRMRQGHVVAQAYGEDARIVWPVSSQAKRRIAVVVVGETARAKNFSLDGYARETNPELKARGVFNFANASSCGTATAVSVPCMFSGLTRADYSEEKALARQNLVDVLVHAGAKVAWFDNNTGSKGVADRVQYEFLPASADPSLCYKGECRDQVLIDRLKRFLAEDRTDRNVVVVLHMIGSHGPAYHLRYPAEFARFQPACTTAQFADCTTDEIVSAYDNTILYTDHVLSQVIDVLKAEGDDVASSMIYMSDHGESLGENGVYLHGMPYFMAPSGQTHIPFVTWFSDRYRADEALQADCLRAKADEPYSQDNLFHSVLGMMSVRTTVYDADLDVAASCRSSRTRPLAAAASVGGRS